MGVAVDPDGRTVVVCEENAFLVSAKVMVLRYLPDGTLRAAGSLLGERSH